MNKKIKKKIVELHISDLTHSYNKIKSGIEIINVNDDVKLDMTKKLNKLNIYIKLLTHANPKNYDNLVDLNHLSEYYSHDIEEMMK